MQNLHVIFFILIFCFMEFNTVGKTNIFKGNKIFMV